MEQSLQTTGGNSQLAPQELSQNLMTSITLLAQEETESKGKIELLNASIQLIPKGQVDFLSLQERKSIFSIEKLIGAASTQTLIFLLISNFCKSINVVRNMSEDQMIECAVFLLDEARDFTLEDYVIMFTLAKRGKLVDILDHIDIEVIATIHEEYLKMRQAAFKSIRQNAQRMIEKRECISIEKAAPIFEQVRQNLTKEAKENEEKDRQAASDGLKKYNEMLLKQAIAAGKIKGRTSAQVPDNCQNDIPNA